MRQLDVNGSGLLLVLKLLLLLLLIGPQLNKRREVCGLHCRPSPHISPEALHERVAATVVTPSALPIMLLQLTERPRDLLTTG